MTAEGERGGDQGYTDQGTGLSLRFFPLKYSIIEILESLQDSELF